VRWRLSIRFRPDFAPGVARNRGLESRLETMAGATGVIAEGGHMAEASPDVPVCSTDKLSFNMVSPLAREAILLLGSGIEKGFDSHVFHTTDVAAVGRLARSGVDRRRVRAALWRYRKGVAHVPVGRASLPKITTLVIKTLKHYTKRDCPVLEPLIYQELEWQLQNSVLDSDTIWVYRGRRLTAKRRQMCQSPMCEALRRAGLPECKTYALWQRVRRLAVYYIMGLALNSHEDLVDRHRCAVCERVSGESFTTCTHVVCRACATKWAKATGFWGRRCPYNCPQPSSMSVRMRSMVTATARP